MRVLGLIFFALLGPVVVQAQSVGQIGEIDAGVITTSSILSERLSQVKLQNIDQLPPVNHQSQTSSVAAQPDDYVFPSARKRFTRFVKGTVGPFSLLRTVASSAIDHWDDSPEEWEQGAKGSRSL